MLKFLIASLVLLPSFAFSQDLKIKCTAHHNLGLVVEEEVSLSPGATNKMFGSYEEVRFYVTDKGSQIVEVHAYNGNDVSRTYATAKLKEEGDFVEASIWNRELLLDFRCTR